MNHRQAKKKYKMIRISWFRSLLGHNPNEKEIRRHLEFLKSVSKAFEIERNKEMND